VILDKIVDGLFIFIGVFFAFYFDQYQEDLRLQDELRFNLSQIIRSLPKEQSLQLIAPFEIKAEFADKSGQKKDKTCNMKVDFYPEAQLTGSDFLQLIKQRGLVRFLPDKTIIAALTHYYKNLVPEAQDSYSKFSEAFMKVVVEDRPVSPCKSDKVLKKIEEELFPLYWQMAVNEEFARVLGYQIRRDLMAMGFEADKSPPRAFSVSIRTAKTPEELKALEDLKERKRTRFKDKQKQTVSSQEKKEVQGGEPSPQSDDSSPD
jgi:hypothetical protein